jgi:cholesterol transport system auxiliary component
MPSSPSRTAARVAAGLLTGLVAACSSAPPATFDLSAVPGQARAGTARRSIVISEPSALQALEADRIIVKDPAGGLSFLGGGQWADRLPRLIQTRLIQSLENARQLGAVSRPGDRVAADYQLISEIRAFEVQAGTGEAVVEISARLVAADSAKVVAARVFRAATPVPAINAGNAAQGLDRSLSQVLAEMVRWIAVGR